jgi:hypothetical protein
MMRIDAHASVLRAQMHSCARMTLTCVVPVRALLSRRMYASSTQFCPAEGRRRPRAMWAIVAAVTFTGPAAMLALYRVIAGPPPSAEELAAKAAAAAAAAPAESSSAMPPAAATFSGGEPVELAEAFLHGEFDEDDEDGLLAPPAAQAQQQARPGTLRGGDPNNPFAAV